MINIDKYHDKVIRFTYNYKSNGILDFYCDKKYLKDKDTIDIQLGDVVAIVSKDKYILAYIHPEEFLKILESGEVEEKR